MRAARPFCAVSRTSSSARTPASQLWSSAGLGRLECLAQVIWHLLPALGRHVIGPVEGHGWTLSMTALPPAPGTAGGRAVMLSVQPWPSTGPITCRPRAGRRCQMTWARHSSRPNPAEDQSWLAGVRAEEEVRLTAQNGRAARIVAGHSSDA